MTATYDLATTVGKMRLRIRDTNLADTLFTDEEYTAFYEWEGGLLKKAIALALETLATNETMVSKVIKLLDLSTNGPAVADALMKQAKELRAQADSESGGTGFDVAEMVVDDFSGREVIVNDWLRNLA